jgi:hypothetical protein
MNKEKIVNRLISDDCDTIQQWVIQGAYEELFAFVRGIMAYEYRDNESLIKEAEGRGLI